MRCYIMCDYNYRFVCSYVTALKSTNSRNDFKIYEMYFYVWPFLSFISVCEESDSESYDETQALLTSDFEIGHLIRERVVPNAVLFFTG